MQCKCLVAPISNCCDDYTKFNMFTVAPIDLVLRDDDLAAVRVIRSRDGVLENTNRADDLSLFHDAHLTALSVLACAKVGRVTDNLLRFDSLVSRARANELAVRIGHDLVDLLVEHIRSAVNRGESRKRLRELAKPVEWVDVRRFAVTRHGGGIQNDAVVRGPGRLGNVARRRGYGFVTE